MTETTFRLDPDPREMVPCNLIAAGDFTSPDMTELDHLAFATDDESVTSGVWECAPCKVSIDAYPVHEMMTIISGSVTLTHADGRAETFTAGDTFFIAKGSALIWEITERLRKFYMIVA